MTEGIVPQNMFGEFIAQRQLKDTVFIKLNPMFLVTATLILAILPLAFSLTQSL